MRTWIASSSQRAGTPRNDNQIYGPAIKVAGKVGFDSGGAGVLIGGSNGRAFLRACCSSSRRRVGRP
jgi:hypothetical protein